MEMIYSYMGILISLTGLLHCLAGFANRQNLGQSFVWFELSGLALVLIGVLVDWTVRSQGLKLPLSFCIGFFLLALFALIVSPKSGAWLIVIEAVFLLVASFVV